MEEKFSGPLRVSPFDLELQKLITSTGKHHIDPLRTYVVNKAELEDQIHHLVQKEFRNVFKAFACK